MWLVYEDWLGKPACRGGEMGQLPKRRSLRLVCSKPLQRRDVHSMWEKSEAFESTPILPFTRPQSPQSKPISAIHLPLLALPDFIGSHCKSTHHKYDLWRGFKNGALLPKRRAGPSAVTASTQEKACFSRSVCVCVCACCDLRTSQSCPRLAHELSWIRAGGTVQGLMVSFEPERITRCAGERQTLQPWPVQSAAREGGMAWRKEIERTRVMELLKINRVNLGHRRNSSGGRKGHR